MKKNISAFAIVLVLITGCLSISSCGLENTSSQNSIQASPSDVQIIADGVKVELEAYNISGSNYFKLRDLAKTLNGSSSQFEVLWDSSVNEIRILKGKPYTPVGGELNLSNQSGYLIVNPSSSKVTIDGVPAAISAYNINGYNYFKLRDLGSLINFSILWDDSINLITIDSTQPYTESLDDTSFGNKAYNHLETFQNSYSERIAGTQGERDAAAYIKSELKKAGYSSSQLEFQSFEFNNEGKIYTSENIIATKTGTDKKVIVVGAHYDSVNTHGVDDNASGVSVVLENAARLLKQDSPYTLRFIFFGAEESSYSGSAYYVNSLSLEERQNILMMVNLDSILAGDKQYIFSGDFIDNSRQVNNWAVTAAKKTADNLGLSMILNPISDIKMSPANRSDHVNFKNAGITCVFFWAGNLDIVPYDTLYQTNELGKVMHSSNDDLTILNKYYEGRAQERLTNYSSLLYHLIKELP